MSRLFLLSAAAIPLFALAACGDTAQDSEGGPSDPTSEQALNDQIMVDPDLANQNEGNAALTGGTDQTIPPENMTPEAIQKAKDAAFALMGGSDGFRELPAPKQFGSAIPESSMLSIATKAAAKLNSGNCTEIAEYSAAWAAKLPTIFPVYPGGTTKDAAGTDSGGCALRAVTYLTAVPLEDVLAFYYSRATTGGYSVEHAVAEGDNIISGTKGNASVVVYGRRMSTGLTEVDLITSGA